MPIYWGKQIFTHGSFPAKDGGEKKMIVGNNNGQLRTANTTSCGACKASWANSEPKQS